MIHGTVTGADNMDYLKVLGAWLQLIAAPTTFSFLLSFFGRDRLYVFLIDQIARSWEYFRLTFGQKIVSKFLYYFRFLLAALGKAFDRQMSDSEEVTI